ncbi:MAG: Receptor family ligand-binding protein, partial [Parcubacteria group bacterium GW2011_GWF2_50_9]
MEPETQETESSGSSFAKTAVWIVLLILVVGGLIFYESKKGEEEAVTKEPIKIGVLVPLTGDGAPYGEPARNVYLLAAEEINAAGGVSGQPLELIIEDSKCNGKDATSAAQKLINIDKVQIILGGFCSSESIAATPVAEAAKVAILSPGSSSPDLTGISPYFFRNYPSDASQGKVLAEAAATRGWKKIAFLQEQTDYALGVYKAFSSRFTEL